MQFINNKKFVKTYVEAYNAGKSSKEVAAKLGTTQKLVYSKAMGLRKRGVELPKLNTATHVDYTTDELNNLIREYRNEN